MKSIFISLTAGWSFLSCALSSQQIVYLCSGDCSAVSRSKAHICGASCCSSRLPNRPQEQQFSACDELWSEKTTTQELSMRRLHCRKFMNALNHMSNNTFTHLLRVPSPLT